MFKSIVIFLLISIFFLAGCGNSGKIEKTGEPVKALKNIFSDKTLQKIYSLQNKRDDKGLLPFLNDGNPLYRKAAVIAFASVQSKAAVEPLIAKFDDPEENIRCAAAYALGQIGDKLAEPTLIKIYETEKSNAVKRDILEAIGKCGTEKGLTFILGLQIDNSRNLLLTGQARGLYRFVLKNIISKEGTTRVISLLDPAIAVKARFMAAAYLSRSRHIDLKDYALQLLTAFEKEKDIHTRINILSAMGKAPTPEVLEKLKAQLKGDGDYRLKINALRALRGFEYREIEQPVFQQLADANANVSIAAAELLSAKGIEADAQKYFDNALTLSNWRSRATLLGAALKLAVKANKDTSKMSTGVKDAYKSSRNDYEKAGLLTALGAGIANFEFIREQAFAHDAIVVRTNGIAALTAMGSAAEKNPKLFDGLAESLRQAVRSGDSAMITMAADTLRKKELNFKKAYKDISFLQTALNNCKLPQDIEAWLELRKTIDFFNGKESTDVQPPMKNTPIDWAMVASIPADQKVTLKTGKGNIVIQLLVNRSPGSAANFIKLIKENFYKKSVFHRVVPDFVIQDGCPRGDGWGSPSYAIGSEFGPLYYEEGSVGMASSGKDTEGSQWFITHSPTPHLDGRYTIFGKVVSGMDVVHKIEVGDRVTGFEIE